MSAAERLTRDGYAGLFLAGDASTAGAVHAADGPALEDIVRDERADDLARVLAAEVLYRCGDGPDAGPDVLGPIYARALELTGSHALSGNLWGALWASPSDAGPLGTHLLAQGDAVVPGLVALLSDDSPVRYEGSREAMVGNAQRYRVKDAAAFFLGRVLGHDVEFHDDISERDAEIDRLRASLDG